MNGIAAKTKFDPVTLAVIEKQMRKLNRRTIDQALPHFYVNFRSRIQSVWKDSPMGTKRWRMRLTLSIRLHNFMPRNRPQT